MFSTVSFPLIPVAGHKPPEELLALNAGSFGRWQICVVAISLLAVFIHGLDVYSSKVAALHTLNYSCAEENSTRCHYANGTNCEVFTFNHSFVTFTEKFGLVCEYEDLGIWIKNSFRIGMSVGYLMTGWSADRLGQKITAMVFLPLQSLLGVFLLSITNFSMLLFFAVIQGSSASTVNLLPKIAVCEAVGNKWRTLVMGIALLPMPMSLVMAPFIFVKLGDINKVIAVISVLPLVLLVPMLYFRDSPNNILLSNDFKKAEDSIRRIAQFNKQPMPQDIKIRPVQLIVCIIPPKPYLCNIFWTFSEMRNAFLALAFLWLFYGFAVDLILFYMFQQDDYFYLFGIAGLFGISLGITLCHTGRQRQVLGVFIFLNNAATLAVFLLDAFKSNHHQLILSLEALAVIFNFTSLTALENITPRMFPTDFRSEGMGFCFAVFYIGMILGSLVLTYTRRKIIWGIVIIMVVAFPIQTISCFWLWNVHNRELPDFLEDALNFTKYYKPTRYVGIQDKYATLRETEVQTIDLTKGAGGSLLAFIKPKR